MENLHLSPLQTAHHWISLAAMFGMVYSGLYLVLDYTVGFLPGLRSWMIGPVPAKYLIFSALVLIFLYGFVTFESPYAAKGKP